jgi:hypothetical protein
MFMHFRGIQKMSTLEIEKTLDGTKPLAAMNANYEAPSVTAHHVAQSVQGNGSQDPDAALAPPGFL